MSPNLKTLQLAVNNKIEKVDYWASMNKLTLNYSKCKYMIKSKRDNDTSFFTLKTDDLNIERAHCIQYLGVLLDEKSSLKYHTQISHIKLSKICGLIFELHHYVSLSIHAN